MAEEATLEPKNETIGIKMPCSRCYVRKSDDAFDVVNGVRRRTCIKCLTFIRRYRRNQRAKLGDSRVTCECGSTVVANALIQHRRSRKHILFINGIDDTSVSKTKPKKLECPCGSIILPASRYNHIHSRRHKAWLEQVAAVVEDAEHAKQQLLPEVLVQNV